MQTPADSNTSLSEGRKRLVRLRADATRERARGELVNRGCGNLPVVFRDHGLAGGEERELRGCPALRRRQGGGQLGGVRTQHPHEVGHGRPGPRLEVAHDLSSRLRLLDGVEDENADGTSARQHVGVPQHGAVDPQEWLLMAFRFPCEGKCLAIPHLLRLGFAVRGEFLHEGDDRRRRQRASVLVLHALGIEHQQLGHFLRVEELLCVLRLPSEHVVDVTAAIKGDADRLE
mmetsp:Transcript_20438/g.63551  ORF Transcript_20438/g.63551 Transcript_20438/m.63551 type:complete len:231 (-) Transcript_20438:623-1315(-)